MTTDRQIAANRQNALRSTGPTSREGQARSSQNALRHGLLSRNTLLPDEDHDAFQALRERLWEALQPEGSIEELLADSALSLVWRLARLGRVEAGLFLIGAHSPIGHAVRDDSDESGQLAWAFSGQASTFSVLSRYEASLTRQLGRVLDDLEQAKRGRQAVAEATSTPILKAV